QPIAELAEIGRCERESPRRVQPAPRRDATNQIAIRIEYIDEAKARSRDLVHLGVVLLRVRDVEVALDVLDVKGREAARNGAIAEAARRGDQCEGAVVDVDLRAAEIGGVEKAGSAVRGEGETFVHRVGLDRLAKGVGLVDRWSPG